MRSLGKRYLRVSLLVKTTTHEPRACSHARERAHTLGISVLGVGTVPEVRVLASRECPWFTAQVRDDGILTFCPVPGLVLTRDIATQILRIGLQIVEHPPVPTLVLMQEIARVDREARAFFASSEYLSLTSQSALVVGSPVSRVI